MKRIVHVDLDAFFASVEELLNPALSGKPVIVGTNPRGIVSSCNYLARSYGIHAAMSVVEARRRCPKGVFVPGRFGVYQSYSRDVFRVLERFSPHIEKTGIDEGYVDLTGTALMHKRSYPEIIAAMRAAVQAETGLTISCGMGTTKVFAKVASKLSKPNGVFTVLPSRELEVLHELPVGMIPGVGPHMQEVLERYRVTTVGQFASMEEALVEERFGKTGVYLHMLAWNMDARTVTDHEAEAQKSMSKDETLARDTSDPVCLEQTVRTLSESLLFRLRKQGQVAGSVHVKIKYKNHVVRQKSFMLSRPTATDKDVLPVLCSLLHSLLTSRAEIRQVGIRFGDLQLPSKQLSLFDPVRRHDLVTKATDQLRERFGFDAIGRGITHSLRTAAERFSSRSPIVYS